MHSNAKAQRNQVKQDGCQIWHNIETRKRYAYYHPPSPSVDAAIEAELFRRNSKLAIDRQNQQGIPFSRAHQLRNICDVNKKECLKKLGDHLVRADKQHDLPLRPVTNAIDIAENDAEEDNLPAEPKNLHDHP